MSAVSRERVLEALSPDEAFTVMEVARRVADDRAWEVRTIVRNRLYELEERGLAICDDERPQRWMRPEPTR